MRSIRATSFAPALAGVLLLASAALPARSATPTGAWSEIAYPAPPGARALPVAFDAVHRRLYRFGGSDGRAFSSDTWVLELSGVPGWTRLRVPGDVPDPREHHALVHDAARARLLLYGGRTADGTVLGDVWALALEGEPRWTRLTVPGVAPRARYGQAALLDAVRDRMIVSGGKGAAGVLADGWTLSLSPLSWAPLAPGTAGPDARQRAAMAYDAGRQVAWVYGGADSTGGLLEDLWSFGPGDSSGCRPLVISGDLPGPLQGHSLAHDAGRSRLLVFGGNGPDGSRSDRAYAISTVDRTSTRLAPGGTPPSPRAGQAWVFDARMDRHYLIGGWDGAPRGDVYWLDGDGDYWTALTPAGAGPGPLAWHSAVLDDSLRRILVWGGLGPEGLVSGLWALSLGDAPAWSELATSGDAPTARYAQVAGFDPRARRMLVAGGTTGAKVSLGDAWSLDVDSLVWHRVPFAVPALARRAAAGAWDADRGRLLLYGGADSASSAARGDLWTLVPDSAAWSPAWPLPGQPDARAWHTLVHDTRSDALVLFGGLGGPGGASPLGDAWRLVLAGGRWEPLPAAGTPPTARSGHSAVYDSACPMRGAGNVPEGDNCSQAGVAPARFNAQTSFSVVAVIQYAPPKYTMRSRIGS